MFPYFSGSIFGGLIGTLSYFYNHGEVRQHYHLSLMVSNMGGHLPKFCYLFIYFHNNPLRSFFTLILPEWSKKIVVEY